MRIDSHQHFWIYSKKNHHWIDDSMKKIRKNFLPSQLKLELKKNINGFNLSFNVKDNLTNTGDNREANIALNKVF